MQLARRTKSHLSHLDGADGGIAASFNELRNGSKTWAVPEFIRIQNCHPIKIARQSKILTLLVSRRLVAGRIMRENFHHAATREFQIIEFLQQRDVIIASVVENEEF